MKLTPLSWIDKLTRRALRSIHRNAIEKVESDRASITLIRSHETQFLPWSEIGEIAVVKQPPLAIGSFALILRGADAKLAIVDDAVAGYPKLCEQLPHQLAGVIPYETWSPELMAATDQSGQILFRRGRKPDG